MRKEKVIELFDSLSDEQRQEVIDFMNLPKFWRRWEIFRQKFWWFPMVFSITALIIVLLRT